MPQSPRKIRVVRFKDTREFYVQAAPFLLEREAEHNLMLGLCGTLMRKPSESYHVLVKKNGVIIGAALRTPPHNLLLSHIADEDALGMIARDVQNFYRFIPGILGKDARTFALVWEQLTRQIPYHSASQRIYQLEEVTPVPGASGRMRFAIDSDGELLLKWIGGFYADIEDDDGRSREENENILNRFLKDENAGMVIWEMDGQPVAMAGYSSPTPNGIRISAVYTPPEQRRKGYASACVAELSQFLLDKGYKFCFLYTDLNNPTSNHIYQEIGYTPVCDVDMFEFI